MHSSVHRSDADASVSLAFWGSPTALRGP
jgi:hypothetical protein